MDRVVSRRGVRRVQLPQDLISNLKIPIIIQINRRYHYRVNSVIEVLDLKVAMRYFEKVVGNIKENQPVYSKIWKINKIQFPNIFITLLSTSGIELAIISLNLRNYNFLPPQVGLLTLDKWLVRRVKQNVKISDENGIHIIDNPYGVWFCTPGTYEYHDHYSELDPWDNERSNPDHNIVVLVNRICNMVDRNQTEIFEEVIG